MRINDLANYVAKRLDEGDRGDRGWWLITRRQPNAARLRDTCIYLKDAGAVTGYRLTQRDYAAIAAINNVRSGDPGIALRRHNLLGMEFPLNLIRRTEPSSWDRVQLTARGMELALEPDMHRSFERVLREIIFCRSPFFGQTRIDKYSEFNVRPYTATIQVMGRTGGWIDRDEYDLFVSRIRSTREIGWATRGIGTFRQLSSANRGTLLQEVRRRMPADKMYSNWRDMALHTFSLFSLGTSVSRIETSLALAPWLVRTGPGQEEKRVGRAGAAGPRVATLRIPEPSATPEIASPPACPIVNPGTEGEILIGKLLQGMGWTIVYYGSRRGFGFDIWARRQESAIVIEVKSSVGQLGAISLTDVEYRAASHHGSNYVIATVEASGSTRPKVGFIQDPVTRLGVRRRMTQEYEISRARWVAAAKPVDVLDHI